ncbi:ZIP family metal transporter [Apibacter adventoris]|uniref:ZIP family metal transporter n=1 Tax=Apibacter adventoris TaxID=1679466 RepID=UPI000CF737A0|nr:ZIP family metal transporter [Apibacter adventoris]PQL94976.1 zinc permease [Apibacter adventoris]
MDYFILFMAVVIGSGIAYFFQDNSRFSKKLLMFSAGLLLAITILDMFPSLYANGRGNAGIWVIMGVGLQLFLEGISKGIEHGHIHYHKHHENAAIPLSVMLGLFIHSFLEGMPIEAAHHLNHNHEHHADSNILWALSIHKISETIVLTTFLLSLKLKNTYTVLILLLFAISAPLGAYLGSFLNSDLYFIAMGIVAGIFLHISSVIIFENNEKHNLNWQKLLFVFSGMLLGFIISTI